MNSCFEGLAHVLHPSKDFIVILEIIHVEFDHFCIFRSTTFILQQRRNCPRLNRLCY